MTIVSEFGQNNTLPCRTHDSRPVVMLEWEKKKDSESVYVLMFRDGRIYTKLQRPNFLNRVDLLDKDTKDGDVSLVLTTVLIEDTGSYDSRVDLGQLNRRKRAHLSTAPLSTIHLCIFPPAHQDIIRERPTVALVILAVIVVLIPVVIIIAIRRSISSPLDLTETNG